METTETANSQQPKDDQLGKDSIGPEEPTDEQQQNTDNQPNDDELEKSSVGAEVPIDEQQNIDNRLNIDELEKGSVAAEESADEQQQNTKVRIETDQQQELEESVSVGPEPTEEQQQNTDNQLNDDGLEKGSVATEEPTDEQQQQNTEERRTKTDQQQELDESAAVTDDNEEDNEPKSVEEQSDPAEPEPATLGSSTLLQDLLRNHSSEIGNWADMVGSLPQDDPSATTESFKSKRAQYDIPHQGSFKLFVTNLNLPPNVRKPNPHHKPYDPNRSEFGLGRSKHSIFERFVQ